MQTFVTVHVAMLHSVSPLNFPEVGIWEES